MKSYGKRIGAIMMATLMAISVTGCGDKGKKVGVYPGNFSKIGDAGRVAYVMKHATPDSLARFIIYGALGQVPGARIDTLAIATNYAYERLQGEALDKFGAEYETVVASLPLSDKMKVYALAGTEDPQGLGYRLGLEYVSDIRDHNKQVEEIRKEIAEFRKACGNDTDTYRRFIVGFRTVLRVDSGKDLPRGVYDAFINE